MSNYFIFLSAELKYVSPLLQLYGDLQTPDTSKEQIRLIYLCCTILRREVLDGW